VSTNLLSVYIHVFAECDPEYAKLYCHNGGTCFKVIYGKSGWILGCVCPTGWYGRRCEYKDPVADLKKMIHG